MLIFCGYVELPEAKLPYIMICGSKYLLKGSEDWGLIYSDLGGELPSQTVFGSIRDGLG